MPTTAKSVLSWIESHADPKVKDGMARFAIPADNAFGVSVGDLRRYAKSLGRDHELAAELWDTAVYEARLLASFVDDPRQVTSAQMDGWCKDFDSWAVCDTACFHIFDKTPHAWQKVRAWSKRKAEFEKRAAFALIASLSVHDKKSDDEPFAESLTLIENAADDGRNFVKKSVNWALRAVGKRSLPLNALAIEVSRRLKESSLPTARWVGSDALRELASPAVAGRLAKRQKRS